MKHTLGPWACTCTSHHAHDYRLELEHGQMPFNADEARANAKLIARAPDLLKLVQDLWWFIENVNEDTPDRNDKFFSLRERVRNIL